MRTRARNLWQVPDHPLAPWPALFGIILILILGIWHGENRAAVASEASLPPSTCVRTPAAYKQAFDHCRPINCVGSNLYGVIGEGPPRQQTWIYPADFHWAWVSGFENLERYARWQANACNGKLPKGEVTRRILLYVGFGHDDIVKGASYTLSIMDLDEDPTLFVPTWQSWFEAFQKEFDLRVPLDGQKALTLGLAGRPGRTSIPLDPTRNFADITGCSRRAAANCSDVPLEACSQDYADTARALKPHSPVEGTGTTADCIGAFSRHVGQRKRPVTAARLRAVLRYCQDVNPCNSGAGIGFNPAYPLRGGDLLDHFTGREFVLRNRSLNSLDSARVALNPP